MVYVLIMEDEVVQDDEPIAIRLFTTKRAAKAALLERLKPHYAHPEGGYGELDPIVDGDMELDDDGLSEEADFNWSIVERQVEG